MNLPAPLNLPARLSRPARRNLLARARARGAATRLCATRLGMALALWLAAVAGPATAAGDAVSAPGVAGAFLAGQVALTERDYAAAARHFEQAMGGGVRERAVLEGAVVANIALGRLDKAVAAARQLDADGVDSQFVELALVTDLAHAGRYDEIAERLARGPQLGALPAGLLAGWAEVGRGDMKAALAAFDKLGTRRGLEAFLTHHKALAHAMVGDDETAAALFARAQDELGFVTRRAVIARAATLARLDRRDEAAGLLARFFGRLEDPALVAFGARLESGAAMNDGRPRSAADGMAEVFLSISVALDEEADAEFPLIYARLAERLLPRDTEVRLLVAELLQRLGRYRLAIATYETIPVESPFWLTAALERAQALHRAGRVDAALEALHGLVRTHGDVARVHVVLGDILRREKRYDEAIAPYSRAIEIAEAEGRPDWFVHYVRGMSHERAGHWPEAEADLRRALELEPDQPDVLNYLGYSLLEKGGDAEEALAMIEKAVARRPNSGFIVDSLAWALYRLGRPEEAVKHMERAVELEPVDPILNNHLGDIYWAVGRRMEARFQWQRALNFVTPDTDLDELDPERVRRKLELGLDPVQEQQGGAPDKIADGED